MMQTHKTNSTQKPRSKDAFTLTETETDKMATVFNGIGVSVQYEHLNTVVYKQFFIGLSLCQCKCSARERSH